MISFSAIVIALCLTQAVHSRGINTGSGLCSEGEVECDKSKCIKGLQICDNAADCEDGSDEIGCECLLKGLLSCGEHGNCIDKEKFCNGVPCPNMKGNVTCPEGLQGSASEVSESTANNTMNKTSVGKKNMTLSDINVTLNMEDKESNMTMEDKNGNITMEDKNNNMTMGGKNGNMIMEDKNGNMTTKDKNGNMTMGDKNNNMTMGDKNGNMIMEDKNNNMTMGDKNGNMTMEDKNGNMTLDKNGNMTLDKNGNMTMEDKNDNMTMGGKSGNMTMEDKNGNMTTDDKLANITVKDSENLNMTINEPVESKKNMTLNNAMMTSNANKTMDISNTTTNSITTMELRNKTIQEIVFDDGNSTNVSWNSTKFDSTPKPDSIDVTTTENSSFTIEGDRMESNFTENDALGNETETEACNMNDSIACEEFDPPCISAIAYCNDSVPCPSQNRGNVCGEDSLPLPKRKAKLTNLVEHREPEEKNFISTNEIENDEHAVKESLKVTESENEGNNHLKIIIPVAVIGGLCLVAIVIWFITKRSKNVDSYALQ